MIRKLLVVGAALTALLVPIGIAAASTVDQQVPAVDDVVETTVPSLPSINPNCDGNCVGSGPGVGPRDGSGPLHEGPSNGLGNRFGRNSEAGVRNGAGIGNPDDGMACDGTRRHAPNAAVSSS